MGQLNYYFLRLFLLSFLLLKLTPDPSFSMDFIGDLSLSDSQGTSSVSTETAPPKVNILNVGASLGGRFFDFLLLGAHSSYSMINQTSEPSSSTGNRRGKRTMPVAPLMGFDFEFLRLQAHYQLSGDYLLTNADASGNKIIYKKPTGFGVELIYKFSPLLGVGLRYEKVNFSQQQIGSASPIDLPSKLILKSYGVMINVYF